MLLLFFVCLFFCKIYQLSFLSFWLFGLSRFSLKTHVHTWAYCEIIFFYNFTLIVLKLFRCFIFFFKWREDMAVLFCLFVVVVVCFFFVVVVLLLLLFFCFIIIIIIIIFLVCLFVGFCC